MLCAVVNPYDLQRKTINLAKGKCETKTRKLWCEQIMLLKLHILFSFQNSISFVKSIHHKLFFWLVTKWLRSLHHTHTYKPPLCAMALFLNDSFLDTACKQHTTRFFHIAALPISGSSYWGGSSF